MGAKTWMLVYSAGEPRQALRARPALDRHASVALARRLFPGHTLTGIEDGTLDLTSPPDREVVVGCFPGVSVVAASELALDRPSTLPAHFLDASLGTHVHLHAMHSSVDWFAFATWHLGKLQRALSLSPDSGVIEDIGPQLDFERPFWAGAHPATEPEDEDEEDAYPLPFSPLNLGEAALAAFFGYCLEGRLTPDQIDPMEVPLMRFDRRRRWWKPW